MIPRWQVRITIVGLSLVLAAGLSAAAKPDQQAVHTATMAPQAATASKYVYLTFDDGPHPQYTAQVLAILRKYGVRATFFELGRNAARYPYLTRRADLYGHSVQNHTWSHPDLRKVSWATFKSQVQSTDRTLRAQTGYTPRCLRPPYGATNSVVSRRAAALGKKVKLWSVDPRDWSRPGTSVIVRRVLASVRSGSVVLMHDGGGNRSQTVAALPTILRTLKARGYTFYPIWCT
ncbi:polysaccharide deacetylase family protein [Kribbella catacumbae]|uniref:polysaccharide deacetylase family protein n=1 Tax=Kribbella catacumbae TaxID=460086 RepID=UPI000382839D|nr:polysaccharide deacetylase family protein [Kribbella catacumbae]